MIKVGAFEAKTHLSELLEKVARGEKVLITKHGKPVAQLVPAERDDLTQATIDRLLSLRKEVTLDGIDWKALRDQDRR